MIMWAKLRAGNVRKDDQNELMREDACKSLNVNEEYVSALRTKSYVDFFSKARLLVNELPFPSSPSFPHQDYFSEILLEPDQETIIPTILESAILSKMPQLKALMLDYFDISKEASNICGHLLTKITQIQYQCQFIMKPLDLIHDYSPNEEVKSIISKINSLIILNNPFSDPNKTDFELVHHKYSSVLNHLNSKRKKVARKIKMIKYFNKAIGICITSACSLIAITAIALAAHSLTAILIGPLFFSFPTKCFKKKLFFSFRCLRSGLLRKVREQLDVAAKGTFILSRDFDTMGRLVARIHDEVEHNKAMIRLCLERSSREDRFCLHAVVKELKKSSVGFPKQVEELEEHVYLCLVSINRARALVVKEMTKSCVE